MNTPRRYRLKPVAVEAIQYRPDIPNCAAVDAFFGDDVEPCGNEPHDDTYWRGTEIFPGDWIIKTGGKGDFLIVDADQFAAQYEEVS